MTANYSTYRPETWAGDSQLPRGYSPQRSTDSLAKEILSNVAVVDVSSSDESPPWDSTRTDHFERNVRPKLRRGWNTCGDSIVRSIGTQTGPTNDKAPGHDEQQARRARLAMASGHDDPPSNLWSLIHGGYFGTEDTSQRNDTYQRNVTADPPAKFYHEIAPTVSAGMKDVVKYLVRDHEVKRAIATETVDKVFAALSTTLSLHPQVHIKHVGKLRLRHVPARSNRVLNTEGVVQSVYRQPEENHLIAVQPCHDLIRKRKMIMDIASGKNIP